MKKLPSLIREGRIGPPDRWVPDDCRRESNIQPKRVVEKNPRTKKKDPPCGEPRNENVLERPEGK